MDEWDARGRAARGRANRKYRSKAYDRVEIMVRKGARDRIKAAAAVAGQTTAAYITKAISERMERDGLPGLDPLDKPSTATSSSGSTPDGDTE